MITLAKLQVSKRAVTAKFDHLKRHFINVRASESAVQ